MNPDASSYDKLSGKALVQVRFHNLKSHTSKVEMMLVLNVHKQLSINDFSRRMSRVIN